MLTGVAVGLVVGKLVGVAAFSWLAVRLGLGRLPEGARWGHILGVASVAGIGFTVSLFITGLAFDTGGLQDDAKIGTLTRLHRRRCRRRGHLHRVARPITRRGRRQPRPTL